MCRLMCRANHRCGWCVPIIILLIMLATAVWHHTSDQYLAYDRAALAQFQLWRVWTAHIVHLGWIHTLLNAVGVVIALFLYQPMLTAGQWALRWLVLGACVSAGLWFFHPQWTHYVGASGVLHGLFAEALLLRAIARVPGNKRLMIKDALAGIVCLVLLIKIIYEACSGITVGQTLDVGGAVVTQSHAWGAVGGVILALWGIHRHAHRV